MVDGVDQLCSRWKVHLQSYASQQFLSNALCQKFARKVVKSASKTKCASKYNDFLALYVKLTSKNYLIRFTIFSVLLFSTAVCSICLFVCSATLFLPRRSHEGLSGQLLPPQWPWRWAQWWTRFGPQTSISPTLWYFWDWFWYHKSSGVVSCFSVAWAVLWSMSDVIALVPTWWRPWGCAVEGNRDGSRGLNWWARHTWPSC